MPYVCWFCSVNDGINEIVGSGLFLTVSNKHFCVTAKHVIENRNIHDDFCMTIGDKFRALVGIPKLIKEIYLSKDQLDLAFFEIPPSLKNLIPDKHFLDSSKAEDILNSPHSHETLVMSGYPSFRSSSGSKTKPTIGVFTMYGTAKTKEKPKSVLGRFSKKSHICMIFSPDGNSYTGKDQTEPILPEGFSGGPIWNIRAFDQNPDSWTIDGIRFCGITTTYFEREKIVIGTTYNELSNFMKKKRPDLKFT